VGMLALEKPIIVGHSHGGAVAMTFAAHRRDGLHALVLLAPAHPYSDESDLLIRFYLSVAGRLLAHMIPWFPKWIQIMALRRMEGPESHGTRERLRPYRENLRTPGTVRHLLRLLRTWHLDMSDLRRALRRPLDTPILILWGDFDRVVPHSTAAKLRAHLPQSELITLQGIGHLAAEESPRLVAGCVHAWVKREVAAQFSPNSVATHSLMTPPITPSFDSGE
jgi:pimeloyl-ACP methyl ester carboxylesterase